MATSPVPLWAREMSPTHTGPTAATVLIGFALLALVLLSLLRGPTATADSGRRLDSPACAEMARLERHGVKEGPSYQRAAGACYGR